MDETSDRTILVPRNPYDATKTMILDRADDLVPETHDIHEGPATSTTEYSLCNSELVSNVVGFLR